MKKLNLFILFFVLMQSCQSYKTVNISEIKKGNTYKITLKNGRNIETKCQKVSDKNISVLINEKVMELPKSKIGRAKRIKNSVFKLAVGSSLVAVGVIFLLKNTDKKTPLQQIIN